MAWPIPEDRVADLAAALQGRLAAVAANEAVRWYVLRWAHMQVEKLGNQWRAAWSLLMEVTRMPVFP